MVSPSFPKVVHVSATILRQKFNESQYPTIIAAGKLRKQILRNTHLKDPQKAGEPWCTHSQFIRYVDNTSQWVVEVFQYLRPDNTIGASGKPDPKRVRIKNTVFTLLIPKRTTNQPP